MTPLVDPTDLELIRRIASTGGTKYTAGNIDASRGPGDKGLARVEAEVLELLADRQPVLMHFNAVDQLGDCAVTSYGRH